MAPQEERAVQPAGTTETTPDTKGLLDKICEATPQVPKDRMEELLKALIDQAFVGTVTWDKNVTRTLTKRIADIDAKISVQLAAILHTPEFQKLEGTWRGLNHLVKNSETGETLRIKVLNISKTELYKDLDKAVDFDQSEIFKKVYETEYGMPGGEPYGALIGDYEFTRHPQDIELLEKMSGLAAAAFCPFLSAASPALFGMKDFTQLSTPMDLGQTFDTVEYAQWRSFRDSEDSRFVTLAMPRILARPPYGKDTRKVEEFDFEEVPVDSRGKAKKVPHEHFCWMNAAYVLGTKLTEAFAETGWCTRIRGAENGGKVEGLPLFTFQTDEGDIDQKCPTEIGIADRREAELSKLGFLSLNHYKDTDYAVFFGAQTAQKAKEYGTRTEDQRNATSNAAISARLPYVMAVSRIAHYLKVIARDKIGSFMEAKGCEEWLNNWIADYVCADEKATADVKARLPLAEARVEVEAVPGKPGSYRAVAYLRPWLMLEELTTSLRLVANIPKKAG